MLDTSLSNYRDMYAFIRRRIRSFGYAFAGIATLFRTQVHARVHLVAAAAVVGMAAWWDVARTDWVVLVGCITVVLAAEAFNSAIEFVTDLASPEYHLLAKQAKDTAAAAVLICAIGAAAVGVLVFWPYWVG